MAILPHQTDSILQASQHAITALQGLQESAVPQFKDDHSETGGYSQADEIQRLYIWMCEHEVADGNLDHKLRESSSLRDQVLSLLRDLSKLTASEARSNSLPSTNARDQIDGHEIASHIEQPLCKPSELGSVLDDDVSVSSIDTSWTPESLVDTPLARAHDAITHLMQLSPSLTDPAPHDRFDLPAHDEATQHDINHIREIFPKADKDLVERLGRANWERRQCLRRLRDAQEQRRPSSETIGLFETKDVKAIKATTSVIDTAAAGSGNRQDLSYKDPDVSLGTIEVQMPDENESGSEFSAPGSLPKTVTTHAPSDPQTSLDETPSTMVTEPSKQGQPAQKPSAQQYQRYKIPQPPSPNAKLTGADFVCPFCYYKVVGMTSPSEWRKHVIKDLEPYMCTYQDCIWKSKTYGSRRSWWEHQLSRHRAKYAWICNPCPDKPRFDTSAALEKHVINDHPLKEKHTVDDTAAPKEGDVKDEPMKWNSLQLHNIRDTCRQEISRDELSNTCPLCKKTIPRPAKAGVHSMERAVRKHIADHLEQLAYFVAVPAGMMTVKEDDSEFQDDSDSEYGLQSEIKSVVSNLSKKQIENKKVHDFIQDQGKSEGIDRTSSGGIPAPDEESELSQSVSNTAQPAAPSFPIQLMLHPPNEHFYAREDIITESSQVLRKPGVVCIFYGVGGVGKTLAAIEHIYTNTEHYDAIFWLQGETAAGLTDSYIQMADSLGLVIGTEDQNFVIDKVRIWLQETKHRWLLIFDNADTWDVIARYMPDYLQRTNGSIILTTQNQDHFLPGATNVYRMKLEPLDQEDGANMILRYLERNAKTDPEKHLAKEVSAFVGGLPVAIGHVAGYISFSRYSLGEVIETFREWRKRSGYATDERDDLPPEFREASFDYDLALMMVWEVILRELTEDARELLNILAYLNPASVPQDMIWRVHEDESLQFLDSRESVRAKRTYESLKKRRLVAVDSDSCLSIHRSLQRGIWQNLAKYKGKRQLVFEQAVALVREVFPRSNPLQQPNPTMWSEYQKLLPHLHALDDVYHAPKQNVKGSIDFSQLLLDAGMDQFERGMIMEGLDLLGTAEEVLGTLTPEAHRAMQADIHAMIGIMYDGRGIQQRADALKRRQEALEIRRKVFEEGDPTSRQNEILLYNSEMEYAISLLHYHRYRDAEPIIERCLTKFKEWDSEDNIPFEYSKYYNKIALVRMYQGRFDEAISLAEHSVELMDKTGYDLFMTKFKFDLACIILQSKDMDRSLKLHEEIYKQRIETLGVTNELSLHSMYAIGAIYELKGDFDNAEKWLRKALDQRRSVTSWPEEAFSRAQYHLSRVLLARGRPEDVESAENLRTSAVNKLHELLLLDRPPELKDVSDENILFDHMLPVSPGGSRFTGLGLLQFFMPRI